MGKHAPRQILYDEKYPIVLSLSAIFETSIMGWFTHTSNLPCLRNVKIVLYRFSPTKIILEF